MNVFPFELPPNPAVSDFYTLCDGGGAQTQTSLPSPMAMGKAASKHINKIAKLTNPDDYVERRTQEAFGEPTRATTNVDLTESEVLDDDFDIDAEIADNASQESDVKVLLV